MKMRLRVGSRYSPILTVLLLVAPYPCMAATDTIAPSIARTVQLVEGVYELSGTPTNSLFTQQLLSSGIDARSILEFPLASLSSSSIITAATLELTINTIPVQDPNSEANSPVVPVFGYAGDGVAEVDDASVTPNLVGTSEPITSTGPISIALDVQYILDLVGESTHLGLLLLGDANGLQAGIDNSFSAPTLNLTLADPGDFDLDGDIDGDDFLLWQRDPGIGELADWEANYGVPPLTATISTIPETATLGLALIGALGLFARRAPANRRLAAS